MVNPVSNSSLAQLADNAEKLTTCPVSLEVIQNATIAACCKKVLDKSSMDALTARSQPCPICRTPLRALPISQADLREINETYQTAGRVVQKSRDILTENDKLKEEVETLKREIARMSAGGAVAVKADPLSQLQYPRDYPEREINRMEYSKPWGELEPKDRADPKNANEEKRLAFKSISGGFLSYFRMTGMKDGSVKIMFTSEDREPLKNHLASLQLAMDPKESERTTDFNKYGVENAKVGAFVATTPTERKFALKFLLEGNNQLRGLSDIHKEFLVVLAETGNWRTAESIMRSRGLPVSAGQEESKVHLHIAN